ncbi:MAG: PPC domain-containing protein, partial [Pseudobdellovibrio sp.]
MNVLFKKNFKRLFKGSTTVLLLFITLLASEQVHAIVTLSNGVSVSDSGILASKTMYQINIPAGAKNLVFKTTGGSGGGDIDIYAKFNAQPSVAAYDIKSDGPTLAETITIAAPQAGTYYLFLYDCSGIHNGVSVTASYSLSAPAPAPVPTPPPPAPAPAPGSGTVGPTITSFIRSGPITVTSGQTVTGLQISNPSGPCISGSGVSNVHIYNNKIGPCGPNADGTGIN